jgi:L-ascorbate metabolism protein UlaG (beta-lactamase superfamily)
MLVEWHGQSAFRLTHDGVTVMIDPFGDMTAVRGRGRRWDYPPIAGLRADLLLVTHEHVDHNGVEAVGGDPLTLRSTAGRFAGMPSGEVLGVASEHDEAAGTLRGPNTLFAFSLGGLRIVHLGDLGQRALRPEQLAALGRADVLFAPVGGGPTIGAAQAWEIAGQLGARVVVPMHYRTERIDFLEPLDALLALAERVERLSAPVFELRPPLAGEPPLVVVPAVP